MIFPSFFPSILLGIQGNNHCANMIRYATYSSVNEPQRYYRVGRTIKYPPPCGWDSFKPLNIVCLVSPGIPLSILTYMTYNANQHQKEGPHSPSTDAGDDDHSMTNSSVSFEERYSPYENTSRQLSPTSDTSFATFGYSFPFCNYGRLGEIGQINITQNVYTHDGSIDYELLVPRDTRLPSQEISSPELFKYAPTIFVPLLSTQN